MLWLAILASNIGTWVNDVAAAWIMAERTGSPLMVAAVQAATTLPVVLLALLAGALADIVDRRRYLIAAQCWMLLCASALAALSARDALTPALLLALTFALGCGAALAMPAQAATTSELVPRPLLAPAVALASVSMNIARSLGPALGGLVVAHAGPTWAFALNAVSFFAVIAALWLWRRTPAVSLLPRERLAGALRAGLRHAAHAVVFRAVLLKAASFLLFASALPALLPILVRRELGAQAGFYGLMLGAIGVGALAGALLLPRWRQRLARDHLVLGATLIHAAAMAGSALLRLPSLLLLTMAVSGVAWITALSSFQIAAQTSVPDWVRARALSLYIVVFALCMAAGSLGWGWLAQTVGVRETLLAASAAAAVSGALALRLQLGASEQLDLSPSAHWPQPLVAEQAPGERGPVLVTIEYRVAAARRGEFATLMQELGRSRRRDGAVQWGVLEDVAKPGTHLEYFLLTSWLEHLRQHARVTQEEQRLQQRIQALLEAGTSPEVRHFAASEPHDAASGPRAADHRHA